MSGNPVLHGYQFIIRRDQLKTETAKRIWSISDKNVKVTNHLLGEYLIIIFLFITLFKWSKIAYCYMCYNIHFYIHVQPGIAQFWSMFDVIRI